MPRIIFAFLFLLALGLRADPSHSDIILQRDIIYQTVDSSALKLDLATPALPGSYPLILCIHGGAWRVGDKSKFTSMIENMASHGYVAASINYRFTPKYKFPSQLDDAKAALLFLKGRARQFKIDPTRVGGTGESCGSQLIMLMGFMDEQKDATPLTSTRMQAIVNYYGPVDLSNWEVAPLANFIWQKRYHESMEEAMLEFLGIKAKDDPKVKLASPIAYVCKNCPPVLTFHGKLDLIVPYRQAEELHEALAKCGVPEKLVPIENGFHGGWTLEARKDADDQAVAFFDQYLKGKQVAEIRNPKSEIRKKSE